MKICILCLLLWQVGLAVDNCPHVLSLCYLWPGHTKLPEATLDILNIQSVKIQLKWYIPMTALGNCEKISRKKNGEDLLVQIHFVPWHNLGCDFLPPATNICIQFVKHDYFCWMSEHNYRTQCGEKYPECCDHWILTLETTQSQFQKFEPTQASQSCCLGFPSKPHVDCYSASPAVSRNPQKIILCPKKNWKP